MSSPNFCDFLIRFSTKFIELSFLNCCRSSLFLTSSAIASASFPAFIAVSNFSRMAVIVLTSRTKGDLEYTCRTESCNGIVAKASDFNINNSFTEAGNCCKIDFFAKVLSVVFNPSNFC